MLSREGRSKYLGPTAGSEWLKDVCCQTVKPLEKLNCCSRKCVIRLRLLHLRVLPPLDLVKTHVTLELVNSVLQHLVTLLLPSHSIHRRLASIPKIYCRVSLQKRGTLTGRVVLSLLCLAVCFPRKVTRRDLTKPSHDVAPKPRFEKTFERVYSLSEGAFLSPRINAQEIALVLIILAQGTMFNIEMPTHDSSAEEWLHLSERALVKGEFLSNNTLPGLQTLV